MVTFEKKDYETWKQFRMGTKQHLSRGEFEMVCRLHSKYFGHKYYLPCTCSPRIIKQWIADLNKIWDNGNKSN